MNNNDIIRRIRYAFDFTDEKMIHIFAQAGYPVTRARLSDWLKSDEDPEQQSMNDKNLAIFLNGLIHDQRGKKGDILPEPEKRLNNNIILRKLKIALQLKDQDILDILKLKDMNISKHELSAFFRKPSQNQYRLCKDQILRNFLYGLQIKYRELPDKKAGLP
jgi:uncharacterized protein YehS (DUF1456 family)